MKKAIRATIIFLIIIYLLLLIIFSEKISVYVLNSIKSCITLIIPYLYIFMVTSDFIITSNIYVLLAKPFSFISRYIFKIPEQCFPVYLISNIGGYPIGVKLISDMFKENKIDHATAENMINYCYLSGPAFIFGLVGTNIFSDIRVGVLIFISIVSSNFIIAFIIGIGNNIPTNYVYTTDLELTIEKLIISVYNGEKSIFRICTIIIFFSSIICIIDNCGIISLLADWIEFFTKSDYATAVTIIKAFIEISNISLFDANLNNVPLICSLLSFGGLCIIFQIKSIAIGFSLKQFIFFRLVAMILSYLICKLLCFITYDLILSASSIAYTPHSQNSPITTLFLLIMTILFLLKFSIEKERKI